MADDKLTAQELAEADKLTPAEMREPSKYPQPKSLSQDDQSLGLQTPPIDIDQPIFKRLAGEILGKHASGYGSDMERMQREEQNAAANDVVRSVPGTVAGSALGLGVGGALGSLAAKAAPKVAPVLAGTMAEMSAAPRAGAKTATSLFDRFAAASRAAVDNTASHVVAGSALGSLAHHPIAGALIGVAAKPVAAAAAKFAPVAARGALGAAGAAAPAAGLAAGEAATEAAPRVPTMTPMSNAIERLRASAEANPRAADLLRRIDAARAEPAGQVTQGTLGAQP